MKPLPQVFVSVLVSVLCVSARVHYVKPNGPLMSCPGQPCLTLDQYTQQTTTYFTTGSTFVFLAGNHLLRMPIILRNISNITLSGEHDVNIACKSRNEVAITCEHVKDLTLTRLTFLLHSNRNSSVLKVKFGYRITLFYLTFKGEGEVGNGSVRALYSMYSDITLTHCLFEGNTGHFGGAIAVRMSNITLIDNIFIQNKAQTNGGAIYAEFGSSIIMKQDERCVNLNHSCTYSMYNAGHTTLMNSLRDGMDKFNRIIAVSKMATFVSNTAKHGGAIYLRNSEVQIDGKVMIFSDNEAMYGGGMYLLNSKNYEQKVTITTQFLYFVGNRAHISGGAIYASGTITLSSKMKNNCYFINNSVGSINSTNGSIVLRGNSYFVNNTREAAIHVLNRGLLNISGRALFYNNRGSLGGGIKLTGESYAFFNGTAMEFRDNSAVNGGGIYVQQSYVMFSNDHSLIFVNNTAQNQGGAISVTEDNIYAVFIPIRSISLISGNFINNTAKTCGGAVYVKRSDSHVMFKNINITGNSRSALCFDDSNITFWGITQIVKNSGKNGGGIRSQNSFLTFFNQITFYGNRANIGGAIYALYGTLVYQGTTKFLRNSAEMDGGGLFVQGTMITSNNTIYFLYNFAQNGGAMYFQDAATLRILRPGIISIHNYASAYGGGIYYQDVLTPFQCILQVEEELDISKGIPQCFLIMNDPNVIYSKAIRSYNDSAGKDGSFLYGGSLDKCQLLVVVIEINTYFNIIPYRDVNEFMYIESTENLTKPISSQPYQLCFCNNDTNYDCKGESHVHVVRGQMWKVSLVAINQVRTASPTIVSAVTKYSLRLKFNQSSQYLPGHCSNLSYSVYSEQDYEELILYPNGPCRDTGLARAVINVTLLPCPDGFNKSGEKCVCEDRLQSYGANCVIDKNVYITKVVGTNFWINGSYSNGTYRGLILYQSCPVDYCKNEATNFTLDKPDFQCSWNRGGVLCGACATNYSLMLGSSRCGECSNTYLALLLPFAAAGIALVVFLSVLRLTVATGMINSMILYANIIQANRNTFLDFNTVNVLTVFIAWLNLDLGFESCFYNGMSAYTQSWLQFAFPVYVWFLVSLIIIISRYSITVSKLIGHDPIAVLATLLLMSYTKLLKIIIEVFSYVELDYPQNKTVTVWLKDANVLYLHSWHLFLTVVTSLVLVFLFLPYTLLLLVGYKLYRFSGRRRFHWFNKLKPLLDSYYAPYKKRTRYWTGFLLLVRCVLYIVFSYNSLGATSNSLLAIIITFAAVVIMAWLSVKIYQNVWINVLEASVYLNLIILSSVTSNNSNSATLVYSLIGIVFVTMIAIIVYHFHITYTAKSAKWLKIKLKLTTIFRKTQSSNDCTDPPPSSSSHDPHRIVTKTVINLREPLLENSE